MFFLGIFSNFFLPWHLFLSKYYFFFCPNTFEYFVNNFNFNICSYLFCIYFFICYLFSFYSAIQAFTVSSSSHIIGFLMHFCASGVLVLASGLMYKKIGGKKGMAAGLAVGSVLMTLVMIPLNLIFTGIFMGTGVEAVVKMLIPAIIPFNLIKACLNSVLTFLLFIPVNKIYGKINIE